VVLFIGEIYKLFIFLVKLNVMQLSCDCENVKRYIFIDYCFFVWVGVAVFQIVAQQRGGTPPREIQPM